MSNAYPAQIMIDAIMSKNSHKVRAILEKGYPVNHQEGAELIFCCSYIDDANMVKAFIDHGADVNLCPCGRDTPLIAALKRWHSKSSLMLLQAGADPNVPDKEGKFPMYFAASAIKDGMNDVIEEIMFRGARLHDFEKTQKIGVLELAVRSGVKENVQALLNGGYMSAVSNSLKTFDLSLQAARSSRRTQIVEFMTVWKAAYVAKKAVKDFLDSTRNTREAVMP